jgi:hypothetical protein
MCDLVMKGGITSGVVYPRLIATLASKYRFKNIGGTSAGAIAAAGCAAAEHARRNGLGDAGFVKLRQLPEELSSEIGAPRASMLFHLFQPTQKLRAHFAVLVSMLNAARPFDAVLSALRAAVRVFPITAALGLAVGVGLLALALWLGTPLSWKRAGAWAVGIGLVWVAWSALLVRAQRRIAAIATPLRLGLLWWLGNIVWSVLLLQAADAMATHALLGIGLVAAIALPLGFLIALSLVALSFGATLLRGMHGNFYGICSGRTEVASTGAKGLTDWLTEYFNDLAGKRDAQRPLTFGDLWGQPPDLQRVSADGADEDAPPTAQRTVNLEVMTTAISQQLCYSIPFRDNIGNFFFDEDEWRRLFPKAVVDWLVAASAAEDAARKPAANDVPRIEVRSADDRPLRRLPANRYLPVVVAVRMSLSFPLLLSAVPLFAIDRSLPKNVEAKKRERAGAAAPVVYQATRVWFSDGGISSNMPLHFFDAALPGHPTFAVNLKAEHPAYPIDRTKKAAAQDGRVYLPERNNQGQLRYWKPPQDATPLGLFGFLWSIVTTMQNWRDEIQFPYPGYRDRIVQISQLDDEGGLNLNMPKENIDALSDAGEYAAVKLIDRFHPDSTSTSNGGWENHQEVRLMTFLGVMEHMALALHQRIGSGTWHAVADRCFQRRAYTRPQEALAVDCLDRLHALGTAIAASGQSVEQDAPRPRPTMRIAPRI